MHSIKIPLLFLFLCSQSILRAQTASEVNIQNLVRGYQLAAEIEEYEGAKFQLLQLLAIQPKKTYFSALLKLYYQHGEYNQCLKLSHKFSGKEYEDNGSNEILAHCNKQLGFNSIALQYFENLYQTTNDVSYLYEMAQVQLLLNQQDAFNQSIEKIAGNQVSEMQMVSIAFTSRSGEMVHQQVPLKAAAYNLKGYALLNQHQRKESKKYFAKALEIAPNFTLANGNLESSKFRLF